MYKNNHWTLLITNKISQNRAESSWNAATYTAQTLKVVSESHVSCATSVPILVFLGLAVVDSGLMYVTDIQNDVRQHCYLIGDVYLLMLSGSPNMRHSVQSFAINPRCSTPAVNGNCVCFWSLVLIPPPLIFVDIKFLYGLNSEIGVTSICVSHKFHCFIGSQTPTSAAVQINIGFSTPSTSGGVAR